MATSPGSYDRREHNSNRRRGKTVSGAIPDISVPATIEQHDVVTPIETMRFPWSSPSAPTSPIEPTRPSTSGASPAKSSTSGHRRTISGNIFSKFNFLRPSSSGGDDGSGTLRPPTRERRSGSRGEKDRDQTSPTKSLFSRKSIDDDQPQVSSQNVSPEKDKEQEASGGGGGALASALKQSKTRKRKGSLRKTALLGGRKILSEGRERKGSFSLLQRSGSAAKQKQATSVQPEYEEAVVMDNEPESPLTDDGYEEQASSAQAAEAEPSRLAQDLKSQHSYEGSIASTTSDTSWPEPAAVSAARLALLTDHVSHQEGRSRTGTMVNDLGSPLDMKSPVSQASNTSTTTDDDDVLTFDRPAKPPNAGNSVPPPLSSSATSYFPSLSSTSSLATRRRSSKRRSPLSRTLPLNAASTSAPYTVSSELGHDYTETAYWGWVLLIVTWITFTVGMGSCLEIWSWAWDVGETPYAPPELEDDPTLPIVGYYPALMVLTGVVSWVWITVAWVGMKYFRHAKIEV